MICDVNIEQIQPVEEHPRRDESPSSYVHSDPFLITIITNGVIGSSRVKHGSFYEHTNSYINYSISIVTYNTSMMTCGPNASMMDHGGYRPDLLHLLLKRLKKQPS